MLMTSSGQENVYYFKGNSLALNSLIGFGLILKFNGENQSGYKNDKLLHTESRDMTIFRKSPYQKMVKFYLCCHNF